MASARRLYWVSLALGAFGLAAAALALVSALSPVSLVPPPLAALVALCQRFLLPDLSAGAVVVLALASLGLAVLFLGARAVLRQLAAERRFRRELRFCGEVEIAESPVVLLDDPRPRELAADEAAVRERGAPALAAALLCFGGSRPSSVAVGHQPRACRPPARRVRARWELPVLALIGSPVAVGAVVALPVQIALVADEALNLPALVMQSCMLAMAALPVLVVASAVFFY